MQLFVLPTLVLLSWVIIPSEAIRCVPNTKWPHPLNCSKFILCGRFGNPKLFSCPAGLHFNEITSCCDWPENANCKTESDRSDVIKVTTLHPSLSNRSSTIKSDDNPKVITKKPKSEGSRHVAAKNNATTDKPSFVLKAEPSLNGSVENKNITTKYITLKVIEKSELKNDSIDSKVVESPKNTSKHDQKTFDKKVDVVYHQNKNLSGQVTEELENSSEPSFPVQKKVKRDQKIEDMDEASKRGITSLFTKFVNTYANKTKENSENDTLLTETNKTSEITGKKDKMESVAQYKKGILTTDNVGLSLDDIKAESVIKQHNDSHSTANAYVMFTDADADNDSSFWEFEWPLFINRTWAMGWTDVIDF